MKSLAIPSTDMIGGGIALCMVIHDTSDAIATDIDGATHSITAHIASGGTTPTTTLGSMVGTIHSTHIMTHSMDQPPSIVHLFGIVRASIMIGSTLGTPTHHNPVEVAPRRVNQ